MRFIAIAIEIGIGIGIELPSAVVIDSDTDSDLDCPKYGTAVLARDDFHMRSPRPMFLYSRDRICQKGVVGVGR